MEDKGGKLRFFQQIFLVVDTKFEMILGMFFLKISNADILFGEGSFTWKFYIANKVLLTTKQVYPIDAKKFVIATVDVNSKTFVMHVAIREQKEMPVHSEK